MVLDCNAAASGAHFEFKPKTEDLQLFKDRYLALEVQKSYSHNNSIYNWYGRQLWSASFWSEAPLSYCRTDCIKNLRAQTWKVPGWSRMAQSRSLPIDSPIKSRCCTEEASSQLLAAIKRWSPTITVKASPHRGPFKRISTLSRRTWTFSSWSSWEASSFVSIE